MISEQVLLESWCQIENSHSVGMLSFGPDGALYLSHGDGASYNYVDYGQDGGCSDPVNEGGALRAQDLRTSGDPVGFNGVLLRLDPDTGTAYPGNPLGGGANTEDDRIISYGFRNPFRSSLSLPVVRIKEHSIMLRHFGQGLGVLMHIHMLAKVPSIEDLMPARPMPRRL